MIEGNNTFAHFEGQKLKVPGKTEDFQVFIALKKCEYGGDGEIRTRGTQNARRLSKALVSATHPRLRTC